MAKSQSTLEKLKALDVAAQSFSQQLETLQLIVEVPLPSRTEYALKWLLKKLKESLEARGSLEAWRLLASFLDHARSSTVLRSLRTNTESASILLAGWFGALLDSEGVGYVQGLESSAAIRMWKASTAGRGTDEETIILFAKNCLLPTAQLLTSLREHKNMQMDQTSTSRFITVIERLIAKHIFQPAKSFHDNRAKDAIGNEYQKLSLDYLLQSLATVPRPLAVHQTLPLLFSIAIRSTPRSTPRGRLATKHWLEAVFASLVGLLRSPSTSDDDAVLNREELIQIHRLLHVANLHNVQLGRKRLQAFVNDSCELSASGPTTQKWYMLAEVLTMDSQIIPSDHALSEKVVLALASKTPLHHHQLGSSNCDLRPILQVDAARTDTDEELDSVDVAAWFYDKIVSPLVLAYVSARDISTFLQHWHTALVVVYHRRSEINHSDEQYHTSLWEDARLHSDFSDLVETSMTTMQIIAAIDIYNEGLTITEMDVDSQENCFASAILLRAMLCGCRTDEIFVQVVDIAHELYVRALRLIFSLKVKSPLLQGALWRLVTTAFQLWASRASSQSLEEDQAFSTRKPRLARCSETFLSSADNLEALACFASMRGVFEARNIHCKSVEAGITSTLNCVEHAAMTDYETMVFVSILTRLPKSSLSEPLTELLQSLPQIQPIEAKVTASRDRDLPSNSRLQLDTARLSQAKVDNVLLSLLQHTTAPSNPNRATHDTIDPSVHAGEIYKHTCHITHTLLTRHRHKLSGRYETLLTLLKSLLRCLFTAPPLSSGSRTPSFASAQPTWLTTNLRRNPLHRAHAEKFTGLLTALCDPTPSSVSARSKTSRIRQKNSRSARANLTDPVRVARSYAGQYAPYVLLALCEYELEGRFADSEIREALRPGVYALLDAITIGEGQVLEAVNNETIWGVSAGMRTILRDWVGSWKTERGRRG